MSKAKIDRRRFAQVAAMALGASTLPSLPAWAQGAAKKRNVVIGHTGITWPARQFTGRRGGGPDAAAGGPPAGTAAPPPAAAAAQQPAAAPAEGRRGGGPPPPPDPALNETIFKDVSELGFGGLELFDWQIAGLESQGLLGPFVAKYKLPLIASYTSVQLTDPARRAETIAAAVNIGNIMKKYGGKTIVIGPSGRVGGATFNFNEHKQNIVTTLNELGKAITDIGLIAALHQHTGTAVETRDETYATMEAVDTRYVKFGPDIGQLQKGGVDPVAVVKHFLPVVQHMHFKDWNGGPSMVGVLDLMEGRKLEGMIMVELDSGGQMPYTPREAAKIAHDWLVAHGVPMRA
jgi:inosose dehydratase